MDNLKGRTRWVAWLLAFRRFKKRLNDVVSGCQIQRSTAAAVPRGHVLEVLSATLGARCLQRSGGACHCPSVRIVPAEVIYRPKMRYAMALATMVPSQIGFVLEGLLKESVAEREGWIDSERVLRELGNHRNGKRSRRRYRRTGSPR